MGTTPPGTTSEREASQWVERMFAGIAARYDFANHVLSFNIDRRWRKLLVKRLAPVLKMPNAKILDLCCGTGDVLLDLQQVAATAVMGADFCHPMLVTARRKAMKKDIGAPLMQADALRLPLRDDSLDAISIAFGFRNLTNYRTGLDELHRVLKPGGTLAILEFSHPRGFFIKAGYGFYSRFLLPLVGKALAGSREAYSYLPDSIRAFPEPEILCEMMESAGFGRPRYELLTGGIAALHMGVKSAPGGAGE
ncbi:MAG: bifunctional demethylmenaquinone methyltransferase/2-methoxy-6-polyprenyl-1,4-benzoquinol methylase UbiE [Acidobacteriaceae bacterium]|nr:bifunctional demethylmenaquinone methyltransferase/2-methoxy-6-polyprenyl-1,4-benzoquinol methylase UbiE [Acidobacteriaceae bacterium]